MVECMIKVEKYVESVPNIEGKPLQYGRTQQVMNSQEA